MNNISDIPSGGITITQTVIVLLEQHNAKETASASILGYIAGLLQVSFLMASDMMDGTSTRRGDPCWHQREDVGRTAINDVSMIQISAFFLLKKYFRASASYLNIMELLHDAILKAELAQLHESISRKKDDRFLSMEEYRTMAIHRNSCRFYIPVALALYQLEIGSDSNLAQAQQIWLLLTEYTQIKVDFSDFFGSLQDTDKSGPRAPTNRSSWLITEALRLASPEQEETLKHHCGSSSDISEAILRGIYMDLELESRLYQLKEDLVYEVRRLIDCVNESRGLRKEIFTIYLDKTLAR